MTRPGESAPQRSTKEREGGFTSLPLTELFAGGAAGRFMQKGEHHSPESKSSAILYTPARIARLSGAAHRDGQNGTSARRGAPSFPVGREGGPKEPPGSVRKMGTGDDAFLWYNVCSRLVVVAVGFLLQGETKSAPRMASS